MNYVTIISLLFVIVFSGCGKRITTAYDVAIAASQAKASEACYNNLPKTPDMSNWSSDKIVAYEATKALGDANKILAKVSLDPCAKAAGTNVYDAEIAIAHEDTELIGKWLNFGEGLATKGLYAYLAYEVFGFLDDAGSTNLNINGSGNSLDGVGNKGNAWSQVKNPFTDNSISNNIPVP